MPSFHSFTVLSAFVYERKSCPRHNQTDTHMLEAVQILRLTYWEATEVRKVVNAVTPLAFKNHENS